MRVIETHMCDGDVIRRIEHDLTQAELEAKQAESQEDGVNVSFMVLDYAKEPKKAPAPVEPKTTASAVLEAVTKTIRKTTKPKKN